MAHRGAERLRVARLCGGVLRRVRDRVAHDRVDEPWLLWASGAEAIALPSPYVSAGDRMSAEWESHARGGVPTVQGCRRWAAKDVVCVDFARLSSHADFHRRSSLYIGATRLYYSVIFC